eukprot:TRINITY_DN4388_c0_g2_i2.p1 TRINITY_DN4388_c0_g2~~TRINITY_DN4388_c0_g2_i2.p1  ORF type:complete len:202 (+),score=24.24 TRINITY_DN4388_c0_g2_i2:86-607(+)
MLHLLQKWCPCGTTDRPEGTLSGAASDEPSVSTLGTHELSYSAPGNSTLGAPAALVSRYTPSDYSGAEPSGACSPSTGSSTPLTASTVQAQAQDTVSEVSDASMLVHLFHDTGYSAVGAVDSPQADDDGAGCSPHTAGLRDARGQNGDHIVLGLPGVVRSGSGRGRHLGFHPQ